MTRSLPRFSFDNVTVHPSPRMLSIRQTLRVFSVKRAAEFTEGIYLEEKFLIAE